MTWWKLNVSKEEEAPDHVAVRGSGFAAFLQAAALSVLAWALRTAFSFLDKHNHFNSQESAQSQVCTDPISSTSDGLPGS